MNDEEICLEIAGHSESIDELIEMVMDRDNGDALNLVMMLHELTKLYVADQLPTVNSITHYKVPPEREHLEVIFSGRNTRTAKNLIEALNLAVDDDGIPL